jgi:hypothetical protein
MSSAQLNFTFEQMTITIDIFINITGPVSTITLFFSLNPLAGLAFLQCATCSRLLEPMIHSNAASLT